MNIERNRIFTRGRKLLSVAALLLGAAVVPGACATTIDLLFDTSQGTGSLAGSPVYTFGGLEIDVSAFRIDVGTPGSVWESAPVHVKVNNNGMVGLGVESTGAGVSGIDNLNGTVVDALLLEFSSAVELASLRFIGLMEPESAALFAGSSLGPAGLLGLGLNDLTSIGTAADSNHGFASGTVAGYLVVSAALGETDDVFRVAGLSVEPAVAEANLALPAPGTLGLLVFGVLLSAVVRPRRRRA